MHTRAILPFQALTLGVVGVGVYTSCLAIVRRRQGAVVFFTGFFILGLAVVNDVFHARQFISTGYYVPFGLFCFIFSQAFLLSQRFSRAPSSSATAWPGNSPGMTGRQLKLAWTWPGSAPMHGKGVS